MLVVFEGCDGVGKSSYINKVRGILSKAYGIEVNLAALPGSSFGQKLRGIMFDMKNGSHIMPKGVTASLFMADFLQIQHELIIPKCKNNEVVLCDRWYYSQYAYGFTQEDEYGVYDNIWKAYQQCELLKPDMVIFITASSEVIGARLRKRAEGSTKQDGKVWGGVERQIGIQDRYKEFFDIRNLTNVVSYDTTMDYTMSLSEAMARAIYLSYKPIKER